MELKAAFDKFYENHFGSRELTFALLYGFPIGIRFEIGTGTVYDETYIENAVSRVCSIFDVLFNKPNGNFISCL